MDDLAHLLLGYIIYRFIRIAGLKAGKLERAAILIGSVLPDPLWFLGVASYDASHTATYYVLVALPFLIFAQTRIAAAGFAASSFLHILSDSVMHARTTVLFAPFSDFSIVGAFDYWKVWWAIPGYYLALLALLGIGFWLEKRKAR